MRRFPSVSLIRSAFTLAVFTWTGSLAASEPEAAQALARRAWDITDAVLKHHVDPPARQQMILAGIKAFYEAADTPVPTGLAGRVSTMTEAGQFTALLAEAWSAPSAEAESAEKLADAFVKGMLGTIPGGARALISAKDRQLAEQFDGNRYVGLHVALAFDQKEQRPVFQQVIAGGPADRAGVQRNEQIEAIDGVDTFGMKLDKAVQRLRGAEGTVVEIKVRRPGTANARTLRIPRLSLPHPTLFGPRDAPATDGTLLIGGGEESIGYLRFREIVASTPHELRQAASRLESEGARALVLDLRIAYPADLHAAILVADGLLDGGAIGRVREAGRAVTYQSEGDALFRGWPLAVLVNETTLGPAEWLAAALQDNHRATIVGTPSRGDPTISSYVALGDGAWSIHLVTGLLQRADGRPIGLFPSPDNSAGSQIRALRLPPPPLALGSPNDLRPNPLVIENHDPIPRSGLQSLESPYGVKPDHVVPVPIPNRVARRSPSRTAPPAGAEQSDPLQKARLLLLEQLGSS